MTTQTEVVKFRFDRPYMEFQDYIKSLSKKEVKAIFGEYHKDDWKQVYQEMLDEQMKQVYELLLSVVKVGDTMTLKGSLNIDVEVTKVDKATNEINTIITKSEQTHEGGWVVGTKMELDWHIQWFRSVTVY